jgi:hypothetical protein
VPYLNKNAAQLRGRHLPSDPIQGAWEVAAKAALRGELLLATAVDKHKYAPYVMAGLAGVLVGSVSSFLSVCVEGWGGVRRMHHKQIPLALLSQALIPATTALYNHVVHLTHSLSAASAGPRCFNAVAARAAPLHA